MDYPTSAKTVIRREIDELERLFARIDTHFSEAVELIHNAVKGRSKIVLCGVGKSGDIAHKIAATFNSTGATAVVLNVQNALHGDLGMIDEGDVVIAMSYSGETGELITALPHLRRSGVPLIAITGERGSTLAKNSDVFLDANVEREACPLNLAPTSSSTVMLVLGDALAMVLLEARGFRREDFAVLHPGGALGRALLTKVCDVMRGGDKMPMVKPDDVVELALSRMTVARAGAAVVVNEDGKLAGVFTHGDFVRAFQKDHAIAARPVSDFMTVGPITIPDDKLATEVLRIFEEHRIDDLVEVDADGRPVGLVDNQDLGRLKIL